VSIAAKLSACSLLLLSACVTISAQTNVLTQHNDIGRTGQNTTETILTPANVGSGNFGLLASLPIDGSAYAQPLYMSSLEIGGSSHSVVFVATEHDSVYAFDSAAAGQLLWKASLLDSAHGASANAIPDPVQDTANSNVNGPEWGITSTPVIDPATDTLYVVSKTLENQNGNLYPVQRLHALDATSGAEKFGGPVTIEASVAGTGPGSVNGTVAFDPKYHMQRPGLLLLYGTVYLAFGSMGDLSIWHGWVLGYNASTLAQTAAFNTTPNAGESGIWLSGAGLAADNENGVARMFVPLGNGSFDATAPYANGMDYGNDIITLNLNNGITVTDAFTPSNQLALAEGDWDLGSGGLIVLPDNLPGAGVPREAVHMSKAGALTVLNRDNLGGFNASTDQVLEEFNPTKGTGLWGMPAYWNGNLYIWPSTDAGYNLQQYKFTNGLLGTTPYANATPTDSGQNGTFLGASPSVSSNGNSSGIVWVDDTGYNWNGIGAGSTQVLYALDATNVANTLWSSAANPRDNAGIEQKFAFPTIADGKVYLASTTNNASAGNLLVYGLLDLSISGPSTGFVNPGNNIVIPLSVTASTSFTQGIGFSATGLPTGLSVSFMQTAPGVEAAVFTAAANAAPGTSNITITGTRGTTTATVKVALQVGSAPDFLLSAAPQTADLGTTGYSPVTITPQNGFTGVPTYSVTGVPSGVTASLTGCSAKGCTLLTTIPDHCSGGLRQLESSCHDHAQCIAIQCHAGQSVEFL
jgi:hypothetical protein